jgi:ankyrin repeat protein
MVRVLQGLAVSLAAVALFVTAARANGDGPLTKAVKSGDIQAVRTLIKSGVDVNVKSGDGSTPLLWAADGSRHEIARVLIAAKASVDAANDFGVTPLLHASRVGDATMVGILLEGGADPSRAHTEGETPLMAAARSGSVPAVRQLLQRGANVNAAERFQKTTALMWAASEGHGEVVDLLIEAGADPNLQGHVTSLTTRHNADHPTGGMTALMLAARNGNLDVVRRLVKGGADMKLKNGDNASAMMVAMYNDRFDVAAALLELGSDPNDGSLYVAAEMRDATTDQFAFDGSRRRPDHENTLTALDLMRMLLEKGANPNVTFEGQFHSTSMPNGDRFNNTPFFRSALSADVEALKLMVKHGADLAFTPAAAPPVKGEAADADAPAGGRGRANPNAGRTAAMVTMTGGRGPAMTGGPAYIRDAGPVPWREPGARSPQEALAVLLEAGANPNAKGPDGTTLLHQAAQVANLEMIHALARAGADFRQTNANGQTALDVVEGRTPTGVAGRAAGPPGGRGGRGGRGGASREEVAKVLRQYMGLLPPAPPAEGFQ